MLILLVLFPIVIPNSGFEFGYLCTLLGSTLQALVCLLSLEHAFVSPAVPSLPLIPTVDCHFSIIACQNSIGASKGDKLKCPLGSSICYLTESPVLSMR